VTADTIGDNPAARLPAAAVMPVHGCGKSHIPPLIEDVKLTLKVSQNMHADTYIMLVAAHPVKRVSLRGCRRKERS